MSNLSIAPILDTDFDALFEIEQKAHLVPWSKGTLLNNQGEHYLNLKLSENGNIIGFAICQTVLDEATLFNLAIAPEYQGKGYGKQLLTELIARLQYAQILTLWLEVRESNLAAQQLYQRLGFNEVTVRKNYYPRPNSTEKEDAIVMALYL